MLPACSVRALTPADTDAALALYTDLTFGPPADNAAAFLQVLKHPGTTVFGAFHEGAAVAMVTLHLLPNVTWNARPYGLIENVVTHRNHQRLGFGRAVMSAAIGAAWAADAYKVMLMTGQKRGARGFYESVGFSSEDKHAMVIRRT
ncbi:GNAT family N-acetyltransferase [uncultured Roseobacter sp.]|uniref:GNAT family N-acetyltransferase n=1 Tax=uncultured Roseobacter sp. TaxID=114847 RepID=UPI002616B259|nr:GNAT family N-acetyltransferase [uncultured Roseobacter sp.]